MPSIGAILWRNSSPGVNDVHRFHQLMVESTANIPTTPAAGPPSQTFSAVASLARWSPLERDRQRLLLAGLSRMRPRHKLLDTRHSRPGVIKTAPEGRVSWPRLARHKRGSAF